MAIRTDTTLAVAQATRHPAAASQPKMAGWRMAMPAAVAPVRQMASQMAMQRAQQTAMQMALQMAAAIQSRRTTRSISSSSRRTAWQTGASQQMAARQMPKESRLRPSLTPAQVDDRHTCLLSIATHVTVDNASISLQTCPPASVLLMVICQQDMCCRSAMQSFHPRRWRSSCGLRARRRASCWRWCC